MTDPTPTAGATVAATDVVPPRQAEMAARCRVGALAFEEFVPGAEFWVVDTSALSRPRKHVVVRVVPEDDDADHGVLYVTRDAESPADDPRYERTTEDNIRGYHTPGDALRAAVVFVAWWRGEQIAHWRQLAGNEPPEEPR